MLVDYATQYLVPVSMLVPVPVPVPMLVPMLVPLPNTHTHRRLRYAAPIFAHIIRQEVLQPRKVSTAQYTALGATPCQLSHLKPGKRHGQGQEGRRLTANALSQRGDQDVG